VIAAGVVGLQEGELAADQDDRGDIDATMVGVTRLTLTFRGSHVGRRVLLITSISAA
jgi:hypothetical protein